jgi:pyruvate formate lyase activating enzyme
MADQAEASNTSSAGPDPALDPAAPWVRRTRHWRRLEDGRVECRICPRLCHMAEGQRGLCFVRANVGGEVVLATYGRSSGFCVDPIEKKPLNHFLPGTPILSFGTAGCNLACKFCQNWDMSKSRDMDKLADRASPEAIARTAVKLGCRSVAFTYNDPVIFHEYAIDIAAACRAVGVAAVAVTAGYVQPEPRAEFYRHMDAANVDLKSFSEDFYWRVTKGHLQPVLDTLVYLKRETQVWFEVTTLLIPGENDSERELSELSAWFAENLGPDVPLHFTAFHPDYRMVDKPNTPFETLARARRIAMGTGLRYVYTGNIKDVGRGSTYCPTCGTRVIGRDWHKLTEWRLDGGGHCQTCGTAVAGRFDGPPGRWGRKRLPVRIDHPTLAPV